MVAPDAVASRADPQEDFAHVEHVTAMYRGERDLERRWVDHGGVGREVLEREGAIFRDQRLASRK